MKSYALDHLADPILLHEFRVLLAQEAETTADLLARLAEIDARQLYLPAAYPSMFEYCVGEFRLPRQAALKRIRVARTARRFPGIFPALADGRLNPSAVILLAPPAFTCPRGHLARPSPASRRCRGRASSCTRPSPAGRATSCDSPRSC